MAFPPPPLDDTLDASSLDFPRRSSIPSPGLPSAGGGGPSPDLPGPQGGGGGGAASSSKRKRGARDAAVERWSWQTQQATTGSISYQDAAASGPARLPTPSLSPIPSPPTLAAPAGFPSSSTGFVAGNGVHPFATSPVQPSPLSERPEAVTPTDRRVSLPRIPSVPYPPASLTPSTSSLATLPLLGFLERSAHPAFIIPAFPLHTALCLRIAVGRPEDPEVGGTMATDVLNEGLAYPGVMGKEVDAGRATGLKDCLEPVWKNAKVDKVAGEGTRLVEWFLQKDLARWAAWIRHGFSTGMQEAETETGEGQGERPGWKNAFECVTRSGQAVTMTVTLIDTAPSSPALRPEDAMDQDSTPGPTTVPLPRDHHDVRPSHLLVFTTFVTPFRPIPPSPPPPGTLSPAGRGTVSPKVPLGQGQVRPGPLPLSTQSRLHSSDSADSSVSSEGTVHQAGGSTRLPTLSSTGSSRSSPSKRRTSAVERGPASSEVAPMGAKFGPPTRQPTGFLTETQAKKAIVKNVSSGGGGAGSSTTAGAGGGGTVKQRRRRSSVAMPKQFAEAFGRLRGENVGRGREASNTSETSSSSSSSAIEEGEESDVRGQVEDMVVDEQSIVGGSKMDRQASSTMMDVTLDDEDEDDDVPLDQFAASLRGSYMGRMILEKNWDDTLLGPMESWSSTLRSMVLLVTESPYRMSLLWGPEFVMLYNDGYMNTAGTKHPKLLGQAGAIGWAELWTDLGPVADRVLLGEPYTVYDSLLFFDRHPHSPHGLRREETYHSFTWLPVRGPDGTVEGICNITRETTARVLAERRLATLRNIVQSTLLTRTRQTYCEGVVGAFAHNPYDLPFVMIYTCDTVTKGNHRRGANPGIDDDASETSSGSAGKVHLQLHLRGSVGVPEGHPAQPETVDVVLQGGGEAGTTAGMSTDQSSTTSSQQTPTLSYLADEGSPWPFAEACALGKPIHIASLGSRAEGLEPRGWQDLPNSAVIIPVTAVEGQAPIAVIVYGLSPRLYWTETYALFLNMVARQFATGLSTVISHEEEAQRLEELAALDRAKTTFFSNISHELRTPLTLVIGPITDILDSPTEHMAPALRERMRLVKRNAQRLINLVNQLLDLSRFEAGRMVARFRPIKLAQLVADVASLFRSSLSKNGIDLIVDCPIADDKDVYLDRDLLEKVLFNLLSNAMKFSRPGGRVTVRVIFNSAQCTIIVADTGVGIAKSELPLIFDRFHRVEGSSRQAEGTGIGLALARDIVSMHKGKLEVESEPDRGSVFKCTFILGTSHLPPDCVDDSAESDMERAHDLIIASDARRWMLGDVEPMPNFPAESPASENSSTNSGSNSGSGSGSRGSWDPTQPLISGRAGGGTEAEVLSTRGSTILLADDNADMRSYVASILGRYFKVHQVVDGQEALEWATAHQPDLIVTDIAMPRLDGFALLKRLKGSPVTANASVILLSARAGSEARVDGLAAGADDYLVKPFEAKELLARVNTHLQLAKLRQKLERAVRERTRELVESEIKFRDLAASFQAITMLTPVGITKSDVFGNLVFANKAWYEQSGLPSGIPLASWKDMVAPPYMGPLTAHLASLHQSLTPGRGEFQWLNGRWCSWDLHALFGDDGKHIGFLGSTTDITDRKNAERQAVEAAEQRARDALESKRQHEEFVDMASHELRNPLSGIVQAAELLNTSLRMLGAIAQKGDPISSQQLSQIAHEVEEDLDAVESIQLCSTQQLRIANDIIEVSKLSMGLLSVSRADFDLITRLREVVSMFRLSARREGIDLVIEAGEGLRRPQLINADPNRLAQVIINFIGNSLRYTARATGVKRVTIHADILDSVPAVTPPGRRIGEIRLEAAEADDAEVVFVRVGVQDTAQGLSHDDMARLFERFAQANPTVDQYGGQGLGLYVSRQLVMLHGGFIDVESILGQGSTFSFTIPAKRSFVTTTPSHLSTEPLYSPPAEPLRGLTVSDRAEALQALAQAQTATPSLVPSLPQSVGRSRHVLILEDNMINIKVLKRQLTLKGFQVSVAMDGRQGLDLLYANDAGLTDAPSIDICLADIMMPVMDGLQAVQELRASEQSGRLRRRYPVVAVTGNARADQVRQFLASGFDEVAVKPYQIGPLINTINALVDASQQSQAAAAAAAASSGVAASASTS